MESIFHVHIYNKGHHAVTICPNLGGGGGVGAGRKGGWTVGSTERAQPHTWGPVAGLGNPGPRG